MLILCLSIILVTLELYLRVFFYKQLKKTNSLNMQKGEKFVWITWSQQPDPNWFGAYIPGMLLSFEIIESKETIEYRKFTANGMQVKEYAINNMRRIQVLLKQKMNVTP